MWPYLMGAGWLWDLVLSAAILGGIIVAIAVFVAPNEQPAGYAGAAQDRLQTIWHAYEQGDLTQWEFARLITPRPAIQPRYSFPGAGTVPAAGPVSTDEPSYDIAAD